MGVERRAKGDWSSLPFVVVSSCLNMSVWMVGWGSAILDLGVILGASVGEVPRTPMGVGIGATRMSVCPPVWCQSNITC